MTQPRLSVEVEKRLGDFDLRVHLEVETEILVLFGPSGAGKTQTLNMIAGLVRPDRGRIVLDGRLLFSRGDRKPFVDVPARFRHIGYVFQNYALFPHLTAQQNVAYALRRHPDRDKRAAEWLHRMRLSHLADRYPHELSGGQNQRVAIARALAAHPQVLLMDEPFSALDLPVREQLQSELVALQQELRLIVVYVTHNLEDAVSVGQRIAVIQEGQVEQLGPIGEVLRRPANAHTAKVLGIKNLFQARVVESRPNALLLDWEGTRLEALPRECAPGSEVTAYIRPEDIKIIYPNRPLSEALRPNRFTARLLRYRASANGRVLQVQLETPAGQVLELRFPSYAYTPLTFHVGESFQVVLRKDAIVIL